MENVSIFCLIYQLFDFVCFTCDIIVARMTEKLIEKEDVFEESLRTEARPPKDLLFDLREMGFYGFMCSTDYGGSALSYTEALRFQVCGNN